jgi:hypothetical protein
MPKVAARFDAESVRDSWDRAAATYAQGQASGHDYYRYEFFGPAQLALCGDVHGMNVLDGSSYLQSRSRGRRITRFAHGRIWKMRRGCRTICFSTWCARGQPHRAA